MRRAFGRHFQTHRVTKTTLMQLTLQGLQQIIDFFVINKQVAIAGDTELIAALDLHAREDVIDMGVNDRRQENELVGAVSKAFGNIDDARQRTRRLHDGDNAVAAKSIGAFERDQKVQTFI